VRVLVVDDEVDVRDVVANMLKLANHDVVTADSGPGLLGDLGALSFDLLLTDLAMPHVTGWDVAAWGRAQRPGVPVIAFTGHADLLRGDRSFGDFSAVLLKPLRRRDLVQAMEDACSKLTR
jgi:CheY-like chemotaxis protein